MEYEDVVDGMVLLGLDRSSARVYTTLVMSGTCTARQLAERLGFDRIKTYRALRNLRTVGIVDCLIGSPALFKPSEPSYALRLMLRKKEMELETLKDLADDMIPRLEDLAKAAAEIGKEDRPDKEFIKLIGGPNVFESERITLQRAEREVVEVVSGPALVLHHMSLSDFETGCAMRGVEVRMISERNENNLDVFRDYARHIKIRHLDGVTGMLRYAVVDGREAFFRLNEPPTSYSSQFDTLWTTKRVLVSALCNEFEKLWTMAREINEVLTGNV